MGGQNEEREDSGKEKRKKKNSRRLVAYCAVSIKAPYLSQGLENQWQALSLKGRP